MYTGTLPENDFILAPGEGYRVQVSSTFSYTIIGDHNDALDIHLFAQGTNGSDSGTNDYCPPFNSAAQTASTLWDEIDAAGSVLSISKFVIASDSLLTYTGTSTTTDFDLVSGESYRAQVSSNATFDPSLVQDLPVVDTASYLAVTAFPGVPGCEAQEGRLDVKNNGAKIDFRIDYQGNFEVQSPGQVTCNNCTGGVSGCNPSTGVPCTCENGGATCLFCNACVSDTDVVVGHGLSTGKSGNQPFCHGPSCDNRFCDTNSSNSKEYCLLDSDCAEGDCAAISSCPLVNSCYHCTVAQDLCVDGDDAGDRCNNDDTNEDCEDAGGVCEEAGSIKVFLRALRSSGEFAWTEKICEGGANNGLACESGADCPGTGGSCITMDVAWDGVVVQSPISWQDGWVCPSSNCE